MDKHFYRSGQFARKASISVRTLRYYDREGLLAPSSYSEAGYRLYTDADLVNLQQILALKFLGFSLDEIKALLRANSVPQNLGDVLAQQKAMMQAKREQIHGIIKAISETEALLADGECDWDALVRVIQAIQMERDKDWVKEYFTPEQMAQMQRLSEQAYSVEAKTALLSRGRVWTEEDQKHASAQWSALHVDIARLADSGADPLGEEAQDVAKRHTELISAFTGGNWEIARGLNRFWQQYDTLPADQKLIQSPYSNEQKVWLESVLEIYRAHQPNS